MQLASLAEAPVRPVTETRPNLASETRALAAKKSPAHPADETPVCSIAAADDDRQLYQRLKRIAIGQLRFWPLQANSTLSATALVNEAFLKLSSARWRSEENIWSNQRLLLSTAAETMRQIAIDYFRKRTSKKRGGDFTRDTRDVESLWGPETNVDVMALNEILATFELAHPDKALLVKLRYFGGMTMPECAAALGVSQPTAERYWRYARAWLFERLESDSARHIAQP